MSEKTKTWSTSSTTTRSWKASDLTPEQRDGIDSLMASGIDGKLDGVITSERWRYASTADGDKFVAEMKDGRVTVNGREYNSLDEVPETERARIETLRAGFAAGGRLMDMFKAGGVDKVPAETVKDWAEKNSGVLSGMSAADSVVEPAMAERFTASPGAVPTGGGLRTLGRLLFVCILAGLAWLLARSFNIL